MITKRISAVEIDIGAILFHNEDLLPESSYFIQFIQGQFLEIFTGPIHNAGFYIDLHKSTK